jgi:tetratricopeptide (TPR) repeat protein
LETDEIKSHYHVSNIIYSTVEKVANSETNLAMAKFHYGISMKDYSSNYSVALNLLLESIKLIEKNEQSLTKNGILIKYYLGNLYDDMEMVEESLETLNKVLEDLLKLYEGDENNILIGRTYNCIGISEDNRGNLKVAKENYNKAYKIFKHLSYGLETCDSAKALNNLAGIYYKWEDFEICIKFYITVLEVYQNKYGNSSAYVGMTYNNLGNCYMMLDNSEKALFYLRKALEIFNNTLGQSHIQTAMVYKNLGDLYMSLNDKKNSLDMFKLCVDTFLEKYGQDSNMYISTLSKIFKLKNSSFNNNCN